MISSKTKLKYYLFSLLLTGLHAHAEITMDMNFRAIPGVIDSDGLEGWEPITEPRDKLLKSEGIVWIGSGGDAAIGHVVWNGQTYYATGVQYQSKAQTDETHRSTLAHEKNSETLPGGGICELFLYDDHLKLQARHKVNLPEGGGRTWCNGSDALGRVKGMDALLYAITYYMVDAPLAKRADAIGDEWRYITVLFRLKKDANGKISIVQDDSCLGNPNRYKTISEARKAIIQRKCSAE